MISSLADQLWRRGGSRGSLDDERGHHDHRDPEKHARKPRRPRALKCPARTIVLGVVAVAVLCLGLWWLGSARSDGSKQAAAPASVALRGTPEHRPHNHGVQDHHVPRSVRQGAPAFQPGWGLPESPDYAATGLELPALNSCVVSAWGSPEAIARAAVEARVAAAAAGGRGAGAGWDVPPAAHAKADADVTVVVSPKDLLNITQQGIATLAASAFWRSVRFIYCVPLMALPDAVRASTIALADSLPNVQLVSYPLAYGDTHAMRRFVVPLIPTRFALFIMNDISVRQPSPWWEHTHTFMVQQQGMVMGVNVGEEYAGKTLGAHPSAAEVVVVRDAGAVTDATAPPDLYVKMRFDAEQHAEAFQEAGNVPVRTAYMEDHAVYLETRFAPYIFDARISNAKEMLNLGLSAIYETGEVPWDQDAEKQLVYSIPWEANTAPVDIPYLLLRRSEGLSARHVAALAQKWGAFMWEDGFQHVWLDRSLAGMSLSRQALTAEADAHLEAALLVATLAAAGYTQATVAYDYGVRPDTGSTHQLRYSAWRGSVSGPMSQVLEQLFGLYHPGYLHADARNPWRVNGGLRSVAVVAAQQTKWQETQPLSAMRFNAAIGRESPRGKALAAGELLPLREWKGRPWGKGGGGQRNNNGNNNARPWRSFHSFLSMHTPEYVRDVWLLRFVFDAPLHTPGAQWRSALADLWGILRRHSVAVVHAAGPRGRARREFWLWVRHLGDRKRAAAEPDQAVLTQLRKALEPLSGGRGGGCARLVRGCTEDEPCWLPSGVRAPGVQSTAARQGAGGTWHARLVRWAYKPLEPGFMRDTVLEQVTGAARATVGAGAVKAAWVCAA